MRIKTLRKLSLIRVKPEVESRNRQLYKDTQYFKYYDDQPFIYFGEIPNMPGHCVVIGHSSGKVYSGLHVSDFEEIPEKDL